jgi:hypothetical protein
MKIKLFLATLAAAICLPAVSAPIYNNNFESNAAGFSGAGNLEGTQGYAALGFGNQMLRNAAGGNPATPSTLTLNLASNVTGAVMNLDLAIIDSWDGFNCCGPDFFNVKVDGTLVFSQFFDAFGAPTTATGLSNTVYGGALGFSGWTDSAYTLSLALGNLGAGSHTIEFFASGDVWQAGDDESWAIDNLAIEGAVPATDIPEPVSGGLLLAGLGAMAALRRRT